MKKLKKNFKFKVKIINLKKNIRIYEILKIINNDLYYFYIENFVKIE